MPETLNVPPSEVTPETVRDPPETLTELPPLTVSAATLSLPLEYPVRNRDDWEKVRPWFTFDEARIAFAGAGLALTIPVTYP